MTGRPSFRRTLRLIGAVAIPVAYGAWLRPRMLNWGATPDEVTDSYPGDELIPDATGGSTMATTLAGPPERVWSWLVQMGGDRGGWYSRDWLDNNARRSADHIVAEWQHLEEGQKLARASAPGQEQGSFTVVTLEPNRTLVLRSSYGLFTGRDFDPRAGPAPTPWVDAIWGFHLRPAPEGGTRLVARARHRSGPPAIVLPFGWLVGEPAHFAMQTRQFKNLLTRVASG